MKLDSATGATLLHRENADGELFWIISNAKARCPAKATERGKKYAGIS